MLYGKIERNMEDYREDCKIERRDERDFIGN